MSDLDQNKAPENEDDELESLSAEEKAAFERIMAEIAAATGNDPSGGKEKTAASAPSPAEPEPSSQDDAPAAADSVEPADDDPAPAGIGIDADASNDPPPDSSGSQENHTDEGSDDLNEEQQAALNKIMAEIESKGKAKPAEDKKEAPPPDQGDEDLNEDQQAALSQIMAEIESKRKGESEQKKGSTPPAEDDEELNDDQQAALSQIMAEIESKRKGETEQKKDTAPSAQDDENLNDDQQAALSQIMAEIESKRKVAKDPEKQAPAPREDGPMEAGTDQEAALRNILDEIDAKKGRNIEKAAGGEDVDELTARLNEDEQEIENSPKEAPKLKTENLTMEEFDNELDQLLKPGQGDENTEPGQEGKELSEVGVESGTDSKELPSASGEAEEFPVLKEVPAGQEMPSRKGKDSAGKGKLRRFIYGFSFSLILVSIGVAAFWTYMHFFAHQDNRWVLIPGAETDSALDSRPDGPENPPVQPQATALQEPTQPTPAPIALTESGAIASPAEILAKLRVDLASARKQIQSRIFDIQQLKSYYERGIHEEIEKIEDVLANSRIPAFDKAMSNKAIELSLRAIQRRKTYITKLGTPLDRLTAISEELLFLERQTMTYEILNSGINGLPVERFKQDVSGTIDSHLQYNAKLTIDQIDANPPALTTIWADIIADLNQKTSLMAQREPLNRAISTEICKGKYERKYLLTAISAETAQCLIQWNGKDLYLNALTELPPDVAEVLSHWQGEWLSLNGVRELSAESAKHLSKWPGRRLSLNGLDSLSPEATAQLSKWKGDQLEMVGLKSIGRWENYGTQLFLSEKLRHQLEAQLE